MNKIVLLIILALLFNSCNQHLVYTDYKTISENKWHKDSIVDFEIDIKDTISNNGIYINLRNNKNYGFNNIFLIVSVDYPNKTIITDTLSYKMTDQTGRFLGTGFTDIKENKLEFKEHIIFANKGKHTFHIQQAMRKNGEEYGVINLEGITDVGIEIEKLK